MLCALCRLDPDHPITQACLAHRSTGTPSFASILADYGVGERTLRGHLAHLRTPRPVQQPEPEPEPEPPLPPPPPAPARRSPDGRLSLMERAIVVHKYVYSMSDEASVKLAVRSLGNLCLALAAAVSHPFKEEE